MRSCWEFLAMPVSVLGVQSNTYFYCLFLLVAVIDIKHEGNAKIPIKKEYRWMCPRQE